MGTHERIECLVCTLIRPRKFKKNNILLSEMYTEGRTESQNKAGFCSLAATGNWKQNYFQILSISVLITWALFSFPVFFIAILIKCIGVAITACGIGYTILMIMGVVESIQDE